MLTSYQGWESGAHGQMVVSLPSASFLIMIHFCGWFAYIPARFLDNTVLATIVAPVLSRKDILPGGLPLGSAKTLCAVILFGMSSLINKHHYQSSVENGRSFGTCFHSEEPANHWDQHVYILI